MINGARQNEEISYGYNFENGQFEPTSKGALMALRANEILQHPWDYQTIEEIIEEQDIKYLYISERKRFEWRCYPFDKWPECYPYSESWPWKRYSGSARIAMYDLHPNLELVLRNGNSAVFQVVR